MVKKKLGISAGDCYTCSKRCTSLYFALKVECEDYL
jgi:3-oxoacyl-[acyl-carrier-protein] synthase III